MNKIVSVLLLALVMVSCKNSGDSEQDDTTSSETENQQVNEGLTIYRGEFIYTSGAAVLKGPDFIYAVQLDSMANVLASMVEPVKKDEFDMVPVVVQGVVSPNPALSEGKEVWKEMVAIKQIISVSKLPSQADVKIEEKN